MRKFKFYLGILFVLFGAVLLAGSFSGITGFAVFNELVGKVGVSFIGIVFFVVGVLLVVSSGTLEDVVNHHEAHNVANYEKLKKKLRLREPWSHVKHLPDSVRASVLKGNKKKSPYKIHYTEAENFYNELNKNVESGKWISLLKFDQIKSYDKEFEGGTSLMRYWGPKEKSYKMWWNSVKNDDLVDEKMDKIMKEGKIARKEAKRILYGKYLEKLYDSGEIGKTHEVTRGSEEYTNERLSFPQSGSGVYHRHWELADMHYKRKKRKGN